MSQFDKYISEIIKKDQLDFSPDPAIKGRLINYLNLKSVFLNVRKNAFAFTFEFKWIIKAPFWKLSILSAAFLIIITFHHVNNNSGLLVNNDTIKSDQVIDSINLKSINDSLQ